MFLAGTSVFLQSEKKGNVSVCFIVLFVALTYDCLQTQAFVKPGGSPAACGSDKRRAWECSPRCSPRGLTSCFSFTKPNVLLEKFIHVAEKQKMPGRVHLLLM